MMRSWETWAAACGCGAAVWGLLTLLLSRKRGVAERVVAVLAGVAVLAAVVAVPETKPKPPLTAEDKRFIAATKFIESMGPAPAIGSAVPKSGVVDPKTGAAVQLSDLGKDRPAVVVFGSWGCNIFCAQFPRLVRLQEEYKGAVDFVFIQVEEAPHPLPDELAHRLEEAGMTEETAENRGARAVLAAETMKLPFRLLLDGEDRAACERWAAFPQRLFVVQRGRIVHDTGIGQGGMPGPWKLEKVRERLGKAPGSGSSRSHGSPIEF